MLRKRAGALNRASGTVIRTPIRIYLLITAETLTKRYGPVTAVDSLSFQVRPGVVTGFLGPNGSGKSTTMRMIVGLDRPDGGRVRIDGKRHRDLRWPLREVGALLEAKALYPGRSARSHLLALAASNAITKQRVDEILEFVGLASVARKRVGTFSLGMGQRLGIATALLGDPGVLLFDEPINGLDPEGILWVRTMLNQLAAEGRTIFISSHLMSEMALTASDLIVIGRGRLLAASSVEEFISSNTTESYLVRSGDQAVLRQALEDIAGASVRDAPLHTGVGRAVSTVLEVSGASDEVIGQVGLAAGVAIFELRRNRASLEEVFMNVSDASVEYGGREQ